MDVVDRTLKDLGVRQFLGNASPRDAAGTVYDTLTAAGVKQEGMPFRLWGLDESSTVAAYCEQLQKYLNGKTFLIWRERPSLVMETQYYLGSKSAPRYQVWSRLTAYAECPFEEIK